MDKGVQGAQDVRRSARCFNESLTRSGGDTFGSLRPLIELLWCSMSSDNRRVWYRLG
ncbi:hypothetical protein OSTOST_00352 [Ostertagia ostertagi]